MPSRRSPVRMCTSESCVFPEAALTSAASIVPAASTGPYVLTNVKVISGVVTDEVASKTAYTLAKVNQDELRMLYGKRVGVTGRVSETPTPPTPPALDRVDPRDLGRVSDGAERS